MDIRLPPDDDERSALNDELHVYPYEPLFPPERVISIVMHPSPEDRAQEVFHLQELCNHFGLDIPTGTMKPRLELGDLLVKIESHQEFTRYKFISPTERLPHEDKQDDDPFARSPLALLPEGWLAGLPGRLLSALDIAILPHPEGASHQSLIERYSVHFDASSLTASQVGRSKNLVLADFRIRDDGMTRLLICSQARLPSQVGRLVYRLIEVNTFRMLAMLALPKARSLGKKLPDADARLTALTAAIAEGGKNDEQIMEELTGLAAQVENMVASHYRRFSAAENHFDLVFERLEQLEEKPIGAQPSLGSFLRRRLEPSQATCKAVFHWLNQLANRVSQASQLLRTRIDVHNEKQTRAMLAAMNQRFQLQLRLQQAAELLSVAIFTYYAVNLLDYIYQELALNLALSMSSLLFKAIAAPVLAIGALLFIRKLRKKRSL
ncbi:MAG: DUF3422 domain-containing protein [Mariprofundaceae bacterium]|nr:DUF3422 domain-containing protein [Mariprofundaceae bacterium]